VTYLAGLIGDHTGDHALPMRLLLFNLKTSFYDVIQYSKDLHTSHRVLVWGARGRKFESCLPDQNWRLSHCDSLFLFPYKSVLSGIPGYTRSQAHRPCSPHKVAWCLSAIEKSS